MDEDKFMLWLDSIPKISHPKVNALLDFFGKPSIIYKAEKDVMTKIVGTEASEMISSYQKRVSPDQCTDKLIENNIEYVSVFNSNYPRLLKEISDPPHGLYIRGHLSSNPLPALSIIGTRRCSEYGATTAFHFAKELAERGFTIISGMARGIDAMAHKGALVGQGKTIAVLGCGVDICYPQENRELMNQIIENGCVISEFPPGTAAYAGNFPIRNRIISGLSMATLVVEAAKKSGTLITVNYALENGRDVYAVPGNINSALSYGTNDLIRNGCAVITRVEDILSEMGIDDKNVQSEGKKKKINSSLAPDEKKVYDCINFEPISLEVISAQTGMPIKTLQYLLTMLEIKETIEQLPGQRYIRAL